MQEDFYDFLSDEKLHIRTTGRNEKYADNHRYPYEPTSYTVLDRLIESGYIEENESVLDYGCGLGRVPIYLQHKLSGRAYGVELVEDFFYAAKNNVKAAKKDDVIKLINIDAGKYQVTEDVTSCFFFNPFSIEIMQSVMQQILNSFYDNPRQIRLFFYYPQAEYISYLMQVPEISFVDEIDCMDLFQKKDERNRIMVFEIA